MIDRTVLTRLTILVRDEIVFLDRGYGDDKPKLVQLEYDELQQSWAWLAEQMNLLNDKEQGNDISESTGTGGARKLWRRGISSMPVP